MKSNLGSLWEKWDLHVHTPASLVQEYGGNSDAVWDKFLNELESLPLEFKVIGVNDYLFIDGYRRLLDAQHKGRLQNIELLLPVIEMRLNKFGGTDSKLSRANFHVIFSNELSSDEIEAQFIAALTSKYELNPKYADVARSWSALPTKKSLEDLGRLIIESVPEEERNRFHSPLEEGFNNLNFDINHVMEILNRPHFAGKYLTGIGKTEYWGIKWNSQSIADKKTLINGVDLIFTACDNLDDWVKSRDALKSDNVNCHLLDCSDAHRFSDSKDKDRLGHCFTWIKADTTFLGLRFALKNFNDRIFIGNEPGILGRVRSKGSYYIDNLTISKIPDAKFQETWFDNSVEFNHGLVAVIGNKGSGKSALSESIGLIGNTNHADDFSFLNDKRFKQKSDNKAQWFEAKLAWANKQSMNRKLCDPIDPTGAEFVQCIPQRFLETVCNEIPRGEDNDFEKELRRVIFSHIDNADRLGQTSLENLLKEVTKAVTEGISQIRAEIQDVNRQIISFEDEHSKEFKAKLHAQYQNKLQQLHDLRDIRPAVVNKEYEIPEAGKATARIDVLKKRIRVIDDAIEKKGQELANLRLSVSKLSGFEEQIQTLKRNFERLQEEYEEFITSLSMQFGDVIKFFFDETVFNNKKEELTQQILVLERKLGSQKTDFEEIEGETGKGRTLPELKEKLQKEISELQIKLDEPQKAYQKYLEEKEKWNSLRREMIGGKDKIDSLLYLRWKLNDLQHVPERLKKVLDKRLDLSKEVYKRLKKLCSEYSRLHIGIQEFVDSQASAQDIQLNFSVGLVEDGFQSRFLEYINRRMSSSFALEDGEHLLKNMVDTCDFDTENKVLEFITSIDNQLHVNEQTKVKVNIDELLRKGKTRQDIYDFIFGLSYIRPIYMLKFGSKQLYELSPGEKGTVLLIFYLLVDKSETPLVIDQPEDNLDNETVVKVLVNCIKEARKRRQIFIVTHNPNLAVVCDADQIVLCSIDKENGNRVIYTSGALENPDINPHVIDILEGTKPAFIKRAGSYI